MEGVVKVFTEPLRPPEVKKLIRQIIVNGIVTYAQPRAEMRMQDHHR